jgi:hypothetical protein
MNLKLGHQTKFLPIKLGAIALMLLMAATRFHHFGDTFSLPDASLAVFFLAGFSSGGIVFFIALLLEAGVIDYLAITQFGVSDFCISPAYVFLIPTYAAVWFGGRFSATCSNYALTHLPAKIMVLVISISLAFLISNGSFYLLSDKYPDTNWLEYSSRFMQYYPPYLQYSVFYVSLIYLLTHLVRQITGLNSESELPKI